MTGPLSFEETLSALQALIGRQVTVFVGGAAAEPGLIAYSAGTLQSASPDEGFDALYSLHKEPVGEALHFVVAGADGTARFAFVLYEQFFGQGLRSDNMLIVTHRDADGGAAVAIWVRPDDLKSEDG